MWLVRLLVFGPAIGLVAGGCWLWSEWTSQPEWRAPEDVRQVVLLQQIQPLETALADPSWSWLWRGVVGRQLLRIDERHRLEPDLVRSWRSYQTTRLFFERPEDALEADRRLRELGAEVWVAWGLSEVEVVADEVRVKFDRSNEAAAAEVVDLMSDLSLRVLTRLRVEARDHAEQLAREYIESGTEVRTVKSLWLDGFEAFEMILAGDSERVKEEMELKLAARPGLEPRLEMTAHGRRLDEVVLEMDLDPDASWSDGRPFTSADVMQLTNRWRAGFGVVPAVRGRVGAVDPALSEGAGIEWPGSEVFRRIVSWELESAHRVAVTLWQPRGSLLAAWTEVPVLRVDRLPEGGKRVIGCGEVQVSAWREGDRVLLRPRERSDGGLAGMGANGGWLDRWVGTREPLIEWRQKPEQGVTLRRARMGLVGSIEVGRGERSDLVSFLRGAGWLELPSRRKLDWWLVWRVEESGRNAEEAVELRQRLMAMIDEARLARSGGVGVRPWSATWQNVGILEDNLLEDHLNPDGEAITNDAVRVLLDGGGAPGLGKDLVQMWQDRGVEVVRRAVGDAPVDSGREDDKTVLRARLVRVRPDDLMAWASLWHGAGRPDGGDERMDELLRELGEALEQGEAPGAARAIGFRVQRLGWGKGLVTESGSVLAAPDWWSVRDGEPHPGSLLLETAGHPDREDDASGRAK